MKLDTFFRNIPYVTLNLTNGCNLNCGYCCANSSSMAASKMSIEIAKRTAQLLIENSSDKELKINLYGGEPLLLPDEWISELINYATELANKKFKRVVFPITTNGTLLNEERLDRLYKLGVSFSISCDGPPHINDSFRQNGVDVQNTFALFNKLNIPLTVMLVINHENYNKMAEVMSWFKEQGVNNFVANFVSSTGRASEDKLLTSEQMFQSGRQIIDHMHQSNLSVSCKPLIFTINWFVHNYRDKKVMSCYELECNAGKNIIVVDMNGNISPCGSVDNENYIFGNIFNEINDKEYKQVLTCFHDQTKSFPYCLDCPISLICNHGCTYYNKSNKYKVNHCEYTWLIWDYLNDNVKKAEEIDDDLVKRNIIPCNSNRVNL
jgi:uncharacterized protein